MHNSLIPIYTTYKHRAPFLALRLSCPETTPEARFQGGQCSSAGWLLRDATQRSQPSECPMCKASLEHRCCLSGSVGNAALRAAPGPFPGASLWSFRKWRWAEGTLASPSAASLGALRKITFEPVGCSIDGICPQGLADLVDSATS